MVVASKQAIVVAALLVLALLLVRWLESSPSPPANTKALDYLEQLKVNKDREIRLAQLDVMCAAIHYLLAIDQQESEMMSYVDMRRKQSGFMASVSIQSGLQVETVEAPRLYQQKLKIDVAANELQTAYWAYLLEVRKISLRHRRLGLSASEVEGSSIISDDVVKEALAQLKDKDRVIEAVSSLVGLEVCLKGIDVERTPSEEIRRLCFLKARAVPGMHLAQ